MQNFQNPRTTALLAVLPHVDFKYQKEIAIAVKMMEMRDVLKYYENVKEQKQNINWRQDILKALTPHMSEKNKQTMETFMQVMQMQEIMGGLPK
ncbi:MAG: hypothetical protein FWE33_05065 [Defluviitaleaceae bacterium]|nr:hypothetical protein [Defluviitaleaceae bacterium]